MIQQKRPHLLFSQTQTQATPQTYTFCADAGPWVHQIPWAAVAQRAKKTRSVCLPECQGGHHGEGGGSSSAHNRRYHLLTRVQAWIALSGERSFHVPRQLRGAQRPRVQRPCFTRRLRTHLKCPPRKCMDLTDGPCSMCNLNSRVEDCSLSKRLKTRLEPVEVVALSPL